MTSAPLLAVKQLTVQLGSSRTTIVRDLDLDLYRRRTLALVGESGSGKTTVAKAIAGLIRPPLAVVTGSIVFESDDLLQIRAEQLSRVQGRRIAMIFQEPRRSLNPAFTVGEQIAEVARWHLRLGRRQAWAKAVEVMDRVRIPSAARLAHRYPFEFSGGMCQRVMIAMAIVCEPSLLVADEPTTALDVTVQAHVLELLKELQDEMALAMLFITHDMGVVADVADDVAVLYAGEVVERAPAVDLFLQPTHPYTSGLLASIPRAVDGAGHLRSIPGQVPSSTSQVVGCRFADRCDFALDECRSDPVPLNMHAERHVRCIRADELALVGIDGV